MAWGTGWMVGYRVRPSGGPAALALPHVSTCQLSDELLGLAKRVSTPVWLVKVQREEMSGFSRSGIPREQRRQGAA